MNNALSTILTENINTTGAGRTDAGVHASFFCAHFDSGSPELDNRQNLVYRLNRFLPPDISVKGIRKVIPEANARFSALSRTYKYIISRTKDPFNTDYAWYIHGMLDTDLMNEASAILAEYSDFTSFCRLHSDNETNLCKIHEASWMDSGDKLIFTIRADRFLRNMVRAITGTLVSVGKHKTSIGEFRKIILARDRGAAGASAPARGLFLEYVEYPDDIFI